MYRESDIMHETKGFWVLRTPKWFEVYKIGPTHSTRCGTYHFADKAFALGRAVAECNRRQALEDAKSASSITLAA